MQLSNIAVKNRQQNTVISPKTILNPLTSEMYNPIYTNKITSGNIGLHIIFLVFGTLDFITIITNALIAQPILAAYSLETSLPFL